MPKTPERNPGLLIGKIESPEESVSTRSELVADIMKGYEGSTFSVTNTESETIVTIETEDGNKTLSFKEDQNGIFLFTNDSDFTTQFPSGMRIPAKKSLLGKVKRDIYKIVFNA